ncbi:Mitochondrial inner membrane protein oxa1 [Sticta canariensis]|nr:Mitochondrial inner membrane protein oxa1 [Sticta canariensis]
MPFRSFRWAATIRNLDGARTRDAPNIYRHFSSTTSRVRIRSKFHEPPATHLPTWRAAPLILKPFGSFQSTRFASTGHSPPANVDSSPVLVPQPVEAPTDEVISSPLDSITAVEHAALPEYIGYLKDLGLDYGWGPTSLLQTLLEHVHIYSGTGWGLSIILTSLLVRLALLKIFINASDTSARIAVVAPNIALIKARLKEAKASKDIDQLRLVAAELKQLYSAAGIQMWRVFVPMIQMPLGFGTFRLLRGMADLPVPGLDSAGFLWLTDLTVSDPYFILPVFTGAAFHWMFKKGGELGSNPMADEAWKTTLIYGIPSVTSLFMLYWPGALQLTFACTSLLGLTQTYLLQQPRVREFLNIQPLPVRKPQTAAPPTRATNWERPPSSPRPVKTGILGGAISEIKGAASQVMKTARSFRNSDDTKVGAARRSPRELRRANEYEEKRRREIAEEKLAMKRDFRR